MYAVVGCSDCEALWVVADRPETTGCPRCGTRHRYDRLERFVETEDEAAARRARATLLAERSGHGDAFDDASPFDDLAAEDAGISPDAAMEAAGIDAEAVADAGERATGGGETNDGSRLDRVRAVLRDLDEPSAADVVEAAEERGVPPGATRELLTSLVREGEVSESGGRYRLL